MRAFENMNRMPLAEIKRVVHSVNTAVPKQLRSNTRTHTTHTQDSYYAEKLAQLSIAFIIARFFHVFHCLAGINFKFFPIRSLVLPPGNKNLTIESTLPSSSHSHELTHCLPIPCTCPLRTLLDITSWSTGIAAGAVWFA